MSQSTTPSRKRLRDDTQDYTTTKTSRSSPYSMKFQQKLIDRGIFPEGYQFSDRHLPESPKNFEEIQEYLERRRASLSPSQFSKQAFKYFKEATRERAPKSSSITAVIASIASERDMKKRYRAAGEVLFDNLQARNQSTKTR